MRYPITAHRRSFLLGLAIAMAIARAVSADDVAIKLNRPSKVGETYRLTSTGEQESSRTTTVDGKEVEKADSKIAVRLTGDVKVLEILDKRQDASKIECKVEKCERTEDGKSTEMLAPGKVVQVSRKEGKTHFSVDDRDVPAEVAAALELVLDVSDPSNPSDDATFGTAELKKVGDSWDGKQEVVLETLRKIHLPLRKEGFSANAKLVSVRATGNEKMMDVELHMKGEIEKGASFPGFPNWLSVSDGIVGMTQLKVLPLDTAKGDAGHTADMTMNLVANGTSPDGKVIGVKVAYRRSGEAKREYTK